jgi:hypothetical protein
MKSILDRSFLIYPEKQYGLAHATSTAKEKWDGTHHGMAR